MKTCLALLVIFAFVGCCDLAPAAPARTPRVSRAVMKALIAELYAIEKQTDAPKATYQQFEAEMERGMKRRNQIVQQFVTIGRPATPILLSTFNDPTQYAFVRRSATEAMGKIHDVGAIPSLHHLLRQGNIRQRQAAAEALGNMRSRQSAKRLLWTLNHDSNGRVRLECVHSLARIHDRRALSSLARLVRNRKADANLRAYSAAALAGLKATSQIHLLLVVLAEEHRKKPGSFVAFFCDVALRTLTKAKISPYETSHISDERRSQTVKEWWQWWERTGRRKYPQR